MNSRICNNPHCADINRLGRRWRWGLCPSCRFALKKGLKIGAGIGAAIVVILKGVYEIWKHL